ncbi:MAG: IS3 family transposase [Pirellulales bacterium]|nr:IS3 family transposase [Pirellulales bacterium]
MHAVVQKTKRRSGWPVRRTLRALGVSPASYYRWRKEARSTKKIPAEPTKPVQAYEATDEEKRAVRAYALKHPGIRHRELAWRMVDQEVACLSMSTVYRILKGENLVCPWTRRTKRTREEEEKAKRPDEIWATDLMYVQISGRTYYLVTFLDEYSRLIVHHALVLSMDGITVSVEAQAAIEKLLREKGGEIPSHGMPRMRSDNGSCYVSREFRGVLDEYQLGHQRIKPHCPEENGVIERSNRTLREALDGAELTDLLQARDVIAGIVKWYNEDRLHSALGYLRPIDYYRGDPVALQEQRRRKMAEARHRRREKNLKLRQPTLPLESLEGVANQEPEMSHCG